MNGLDLKYIKTVTWREVFKNWQEGESTLPRWIEHYKQRGFNSWEEWRGDSIKDLHLDQLVWKAYKIGDTKTVSEFYGGPFRAWIKKYYGNREIVRFKELAEKPELQKDPTIQEIIKNFPKESTVIALLKDEKIIVIEGMHRCSALAVANLEGIKINTDLTVMLAEFDKELPLLGQLGSPT